MTATSRWKGPRSFPPANSHAMIQVCSTISHEPSRRQSTRPVRDYGCTRCRRHGEVYRARDTRLDRTVAIKVLHTDAAGDRERRERFEREARAVAALNHPYICVLYDVGREESTDFLVDFLVMELVDGESLDERLRRGALPRDEAVRLALQLVDAL